MEIRQHLGTFLVEFNGRWKSRYFGWNTNAWSDAHGFPYELESVSIHGNVGIAFSKTRAFVAVDEDENGKPVVEKWVIRGLRFFGEHEPRMRLGKMTLAKDGTVKQNPIDESRELFLYALHSSPALVKLSIEALKGKRDWASVSRQAARDYSAEHGDGAAQWSRIFSRADLAVVSSMLREHYESNADTHKSNPLVRVKVKSPPQRPAGTTAKPSKRLVARRKATKAAPEGFYANPAPAFPYRVESRASGARGWLPRGSFKTSVDAKQYARALANANPEKTIRVVTSDVKPFSIDAGLRSVK